VRAFAEAARGLNARLVIVGWGPEHDAILKEARTLSVENRVHLPGFLPDPHRYVGLFDVFAITSDTEQFPLSLTEAMAARLPVVSTAVGDIPEIVSAENLPYVTPKEDETALASNLRKFLSDASLRGAVGAANRVRVEREFTLRAMCERYHSLYENARKRRPQ